MKNVWKEKREETLGRKSKQHKAYASTDTLKKIRYSKDQIRHSKANKEVRRSTRKDRRNLVNDLARQAEEAAGNADSKELYSITRALAGAQTILDRPVRANSGEVLTDQEEKRKR